MRSPRWRYPTSFRTIVQVFPIRLEGIFQSLQVFAEARLKGEVAGNVGVLIPEFEDVIQNLVLMVAKGTGHTLHLVGVETQMP